MPTRPLTHPDLLPASHLLAAAFHADPIFGAFVHPHRDAHPQDIHLYWLRFLREALYTPNEHLIITYTEPSQPGQEQIVTGLAHWIRNTSAPPQPSWASRAALFAVQKYNAAEEYFYPNRALCPANDALIPQGVPFFAHHWSGSRADSWHLSLLGVDPPYGKRGFGRELVSWGMERARGEGVSCSVISVPGQEGFYGKCGFDCVLGGTGDEGGEANVWRAAGLESMPVMVKDWGEVVGVKKYGEE